MPAIIIERQECKEDMWKALKRHIVRSRQKKKEELEEEEAEERLRKLREEQDQKDRMTLGETREQLRGMEDHLTKLKDEKHQLFLQLKKVLNEDELRRRISNARVDLSELSQPYSLVPISAGTGGAGGHQQQLFLQPHNPQSPLPARHLYKVGHLPGGLLPPQDVVEDGRRGHGEYGGRAILWNKSHSYSTTTAPGFYPGHHPGTMYTAHIIPTVPTHHVAPPTAAPPTSTAPPPSAISTTERERERERENREREREQRENRGREIERERDRDDPPVSKPGHVQFMTQARPPHTQYQDKFYSVRQPTHVPIHGGAIPIQQPPQGAKTGSITSGFPVRSPAPPASPHASPQPRPTTFQPAGPIISSQPLSIYAPHRLTICTPTTSAPSGHPSSLGHLQNVPAGHPVGHPSSHSANLPPGHPPSSHPPSHPTPHSSTHTVVSHAPSHATSHALTHSSGLPSHTAGHHPNHPSHAANHSHPQSHVVSHSSGHSSHPHQPIHSIGHTSVLHSSHQQVHVNVSQGHQGPPGRFTMSNMPRES